MLRLSARNRLLIALLVTSTVVGAACAKLNTSGNLEVAAATTHVLIDDADVSIVDRTALPQDLRTIQARAELYGRLMTTPPVLNAIGKRAGLPPDQISGIADMTADVPIQFAQAGSEEHANQLWGSRKPYRLELQSDPVEPILAIYAEAPSLNSALRLANGAVAGLRDYLSKLAQQQGVPVRALPQLRQLGDARGAITNSSARIEIAGLTFLTAFALSFVSLFLLVRKPWRRREERPGSVARSRLRGRAAADWPGTTRVLPWSIAALIGMFWLTPFDKIQLAGGGAPVNITLDRIVLPIVALIWLVSFKTGPGAAPRLRMTRVHVAIYAYLACAFLSVVLDVHYLNHTGELMIAVKKLPLLVSYLSVFVIVASSVRRSEVLAFLNYTLILAVIVALGAIYEYRSGSNIFTTLATTVFRGPFTLASGDPTNGAVLDSLHRRTVLGPAAYGVELVTMLSIALPLAVLGLQRATTRGRYILYGLAIAVLLYAMLTTARKSALVAPSVVFMTLAYLRRRQLLSLAPLGLVLVVVLIAAAPASVRNVISQYTSANASHVATVESRTANFDAVRPDLWTHLLFGRGQGTYAPPTDRIIDSDIILPLVETGVLGLVAFMMIPMSIIFVARKAAASPEPGRSIPAVCGVSAGVCFITVATLYSVLSLPHGPDVFLYVAALVVVAVGSDASPAMRHRKRSPDLAREHTIRAHPSARASRPRAVSASWPEVGVTSER